MQPRPPRKATRALVPAKPSSAAPPAFVQLIRASDTASVLEVRIGRTTIQVRRGFDAELLRSSDDRAWLADLRGARARGHAARK